MSDDDVDDCNDDCHYQARTLCAANGRTRSSNSSAMDSGAASSNPGASQPGSRDQARRRAVAEFRTMTGIGPPGAEPAAAPAAPNDAAPADALTVAPDGLQLAVTLPPWHESEFLLTTLPRQQAEFDASGYVVNVATNPRQAMNRA